MLHYDELAEFGNEFDSLLCSPTLLAWRHNWTQEWTQEDLEPAAVMAVMERISA